MNILHLEYFITIVDCQFNLSKASEVLHVSQPALSNFIVRFEQMENVHLFVRQHGRNTLLTPAGEVFYHHALDIVERYKEMMTHIHELSHFTNGIVRIGVPPLVLSVLFTKVLSQLISNNPYIKFEILEYGAYELMTKLNQNEIDIAIILQPNAINLKLFNEILLYEDELIAYTSKNHPLLNECKNDLLMWQSLESYQLATFDETFMIYHLLKKKFQEKKINPKMIVQSVSWDFLVETVKESQLVTILPGPLDRLIKNETLEKIHFQEPIPWKVSMLFQKKNKYTPVEKYVIDALQNYFLKNKSIQAMQDEIKRK